MKTTRSGTVVPPRRPSGSASASAIEPAEVHRLHAELCKVLTDPKRLMVIEALREGERCVGELAEAIGMSLPNASQHLSVLRHAGLVDTRREGTTVHYRLTEPRILEACDIVQRIVADRLMPAAVGAPSRGGATGGKQRSAG